MSHALFGAVAGAITMASLIPYVVSILRGTTIPARTTYLVKSVVGVLVLASYWSVGARDTAWTTLVFAVGPLLVWSLAIRRGIGGWTPLDRICLATALVALCGWFISDNPIVALLAGVSIKWLSILPTLTKLATLPASESRLSWLMALAGDAVNLLALTTFNPAIALPALNEVVLSATVTAALVGTTRTRSSAHEPIKAANAASTTPCNRRVHGGLTRAARLLKHRGQQSHNQRAAAHQSPRDNGAPETKQVRPCRPAHARTRQRTQG